MTLRVAPQPVDDGRRLIVVQVPAGLRSLLGLPGRSGLVRLAGFSSRSELVAAALRRWLSVAEPDESEPRR